MQLLLLTVLFLTGIQYTISADSQCYECTDSGCGDPFSENSQVKKAPSNNGWCLKTKTETNGQITVSRGPATKAGCSNTCDKQSDKGITTTSCCCTSNLCNTSSRLTFTYGIGFLICLIVLHFSVKFY